MIPVMNKSSSIYEHDFQQMCQSNMPVFLARAVSSALTKRSSEHSNPLWIVVCKPEMDSSCFILWEEILVKAMFFFLVNEVELEH